MILCRRTPYNSEANCCDQSNKSPSFLWRIRTATSQHSSFLQVISDWSRFLQSQSNLIISVDASSLTLWYIRLLQENSSLCRLEVTLSESAGVSVLSLSVYHTQIYRLKIQTLKWHSFFLFWVLLTLIKIVSHTAKKYT